MTATHENPPPPALVPAHGEQGLLSGGLAEIERRTLAAWDIFIAAAEKVDLAGGTRSRSKRGGDLLVGVGRWPDSRGIPEMVADGYSGRIATTPHETLQKTLLANYAGSSRERVMAALQEARDEAKGWFADPAAAQEAELITPSLLGPLPVATVVHAAVFQLAVTARDLVPAGAPPNPELDVLGLTALVDSTGAVAARLQATASITSINEAGRVGTGAVAGSWRTAELGPDDESGPAVEAPVGLLLDLAAGRIDFIQVARKVRVHQPRGLLAISVILDDMPELPGGEVLRRAGRLVRRLSIR